MNGPLEFFLARHFPPASSTLTPSHWPVWWKFPVPKNRERSLARTNRSERAKNLSHSINMGGGLYRLDRQDIFRNNNLSLVSARWQSCLLVTNKSRLFRNIFPKIWIKLVPYWWDWNPCSSFFKELLSFFCFFILDSCLKTSKKAQDLGQVRRM